MKKKLKMEVQIYTPIITIRLKPAAKKNRNTLEYCYLTYEKEYCEFLDIKITAENQSPTPL